VVVAGLDRRKRPPGESQDAQPTPGETTDVGPARWWAQWSIDLRVTSPPGRLCRVLASFIGAVLVCGPGLTIYFAAALLGAPNWLQWVALAPLLVSGALWTRLWREVEAPDADPIPARNRSGVALPT
jgi:hypothetical protein